MTNPQRPKREATDPRRLKRGATDPQRPKREATDPRRPKRGTVEASDGSIVHYRLDGNTDDPSAPLIYCLHGFGMNEDWFARLFHPLLDRPYRFAFLRAPFVVKSNDDGSVGCSWYDYDGDQTKYLVELNRTETLLEQVRTGIEAHAGLVPSSRILLGFSQGGYCGGFVALRRSDLYQGLIISGARIKTEALKDELPEAARNGIRVLICHGSRDPHVLPEAATRSYEGLIQHGIKVQLETFDAAHSLSRGQLRFMGTWIEEIVTGSS